jgi:hypothetical protein
LINILFILLVKSCSYFHDLIAATQVRFDQNRFMIAILQSFWHLLISTYELVFLNVYNYHRGWYSLFHVPSHFNTALIRVDHERPPETICTWFFPDGDHVCHDNPVIPEVTLDAQHKREIIVINQINLNSVLILL